MLYSTGKPCINDRVLNSKNKIKEVDLESDQSRWGRRFNFLILVRNSFSKNVFTKSRIPFNFEFLL